MQSSMGLTIRRGTRCALHSSCDGGDNLLLGAGKSEIDRATRKSCVFCWGVFINKQSTRIDATGMQLINSQSGILIVITPSFTIMGSFVHESFSKSQICLIVFNSLDRNNLT